MFPVKMKIELTLIFFAVIFAFMKKRGSMKIV